MKPNTFSETEKPIHAPMAMAIAELTSRFRRSDKWSEKRHPSVGVIAERKTDRSTSGVVVAIVGLFLGCGYDNFGLRGTLVILVSVILVHMEMDCIISSFWKTFWDIGRSGFRCRRRGFFWSRSSRFLYRVRLAGFPARTILAARFLPGWSSPG